MNRILTHSLGYPRIGSKRELKKATELYWKGEIPLAALESIGRELRRHHWQKQANAGIDLLPCNDFSFYDHILDASCLFGNVPSRFSCDGKHAHLDTRFHIARGQRDHHQACCPSHGFASEMTKWFDTNYHYIVPEFRADTTFQLSDTKIFDEFHEATQLGFKAKPVLVGPMTYLSLGKVHDPEHPDFNRFSLLDRLLPVYHEIFSRLASLGASWIQLDEPVLCLDLEPSQQDAILTAYQNLARAAGPLKLLVTSYFGELRDNLPLFLSLPVHALHVDAVRGHSEIGRILENFPPEKILSLGIVDGRNVWKNDFDTSLATLEKARQHLGESRLWISSSCSLLHSPVTLASEKQLNPEILDWLAFADEKLIEIHTLRQLLSNSGDPNLLEANRASHHRRRTSTLIHQPAVQERLSTILPSHTRRNSPFPLRRSLQQRKLQLPLFPTTTIGSFPQTQEIRAARAKWKKGTLTDLEYQTFLEKQTRQCVRWQDEIGIDMLVHGEFERNDMVEYFGEQLDGFTFTSNGWVQSYGTRCVKPPLIFGDVSRPRPMTTFWSSFAQSLTHRPMKGMLTGPVTILQWSFARDDQPREITARQIALAIRDEVLDLETAGIPAIQIDEPAIREGLPLRRTDWPAYLKWAVESFRLSSSGVRDETQIHTHMCYSEFNDIIDAIADMDADVITIETSRSNMELLEAFVDFRYPNEIGPGVYDIHSPQIPSIAQMENLLTRASAVLPAENLWVNPDCGLKTRQWEEVKPSLVHLVAAARKLRSRFTETTSPSH